MKTASDDRARLNSWECALIRRALELFGNREDWRSSTYQVFASHISRLSTKLAREQDRQVRRGN